MLEAVGARAGRRALLADVALQVAPGELVAVLGPSGAGKTTLLRLVAGLDAPTAGTIRWAGEVLSSAGRVHVPPERRGASLLFQEGVLFPHLDVRGNVALGVPPGTARDDAERRVTAALETARIAHLAKAGAARLSGGEQQRVALARALAQESRLLLLDEPFHSLDEALKGEIIADVGRVVRERRLAAVLVTHVVEEAAALATRWARLEGGRLTASGAIDTLSRRPPDSVHSATRAEEVRS